MSVKILVEDLYIDFTFNKEMNLERRFFIKLEINEKDSEVLIFMNEMNSSFLKHGKLHNAVMLENKDIAAEFNEKEENSKVKSIKELLILGASNLYATFNQIVISNLEAMEESTWLDFCKTRYAHHNINFSEEDKNKELLKFRKSNEKIKEIWLEFPKSMSQFMLGGDIEKAEEIPNKLAHFWTNAHFNHLNNKFKSQNISEKKPKI